MIFYIFLIALFTVGLIATIYDIIKTRKGLPQINVKKLYIENCVYKILVYVLAILSFLENIARTKGW